MSAQVAWRVIHRARIEGAHLKLGPDGKILLDFPERFPLSLLAELRTQRDAVAAVLQDEADEETALRRWFPNYGVPVFDRKTGRSGKVWGATKHGLIVDFGLGTPLLTLDPREVVAKS
ncbi:MAG: hypothetical protein HONBIEJF_00333 [Fimbriimonadaceae bacterium]|nr:hypothetical protein [Fimbriimonadaceae bacterium]